MISADQPAPNPFWFHECIVMTMPTGKKAANLRELLQTLREVDESVLSYHLWQSRVAIAPPDVEYLNDFVAWAANSLQDSRLAEKLSVIDPFGFENLQEVRDNLVDTLDEYLWDLPSVPWARPGFEFHFCEASVVVLRSQISARTLSEFCQALTQVSRNSIYYHFMDARWRLRSMKTDDFSNWIVSSYDLPDLVSALQGIDVWFYTLEEVRDAILNLVSQYMEKTDDNPPRET
ncbi:conserved hypothetical protein [Syntrophobacter sp. SbD1]|nr:conserved hypothetical protein [Syntrophobacter sp. SbD1]